MSTPGKRGAWGWAVGVLAASLAAGWAAANRGGDVVRLENRHLRLGVERGSGRCVELVDRGTGQNFAGNGVAGGGLWRIEFEGSPALILGPTNASACVVEPARGDEPGWVMRWSGFGRPEMPELGVEVAVRLAPGRAASRWQIAVNGTAGRAMTKIRFPRVVDLPRLEEERLVMPSWGGLLTRRPRKVFASLSPNGVRQEYDYPGRCSMQCMAFYGEGGPGIYVSCDDAAGYRKAFAAFSQPGARLNLELVHLPENGATNASPYLLPYTAEIGTFRGDWYDAAAIYRTWATNQTWARESRWKRGLVPRWIAETGAWVWNRGRSTNVLEPATALQRASGLPVSVFWHWWHGCAYDTGFPEYLPPREGAEPFRAALDRAHANDVHALVYMNQRLWGMSTASWTNEHASVHAVKASDGTVKPEVYNVFNRQPCATMCLGTPFWRRKYAGLATEAYVGLGVDGIYMDQACTSLACHDPAHGHARGGGTYWMAGFREMAADIRERSRARGTVALAGEGCAENWLPHLDLMLALDVSRDRFAAPDGWEAIPFFHAVYHGYGVFYGNYSSLTMPPYDDLWPAETAPKEPLKLLDARFAPQFRLEQARSFIWGQQPTIANFRPAQLEERPGEIDFVLRLARARLRAMKFLQDGTMLAPPVVETRKARIPISRLSIYAGQQGGLNEYRKLVSPVLASAWQAADGTVGLAVASISDEVLHPRVRLAAPRPAWGRGGRVFRITDGGADEVGEVSGPEWVLTPELGPRAVEVYEVRER